MPGNGVGDRVHNFFAQDNLPQGLRSQDGNWPLNDNLWAGNQKQFGVSDSSPRNYNQQQQETERGHGSQRVPDPHTFNITQTNARPEFARSLSQSHHEQPGSNGYMYGRQNFQTRPDEANFLGIDTEYGRNNVSQRGIPFYESQQEPAPDQTPKNPFRSESSEAHGSFDLFGGQHQTNSQYPGFLQQPLQQQQQQQQQQQHQQQQQMMMAAASQGQSQSQSQQKIPLPSQFPDQQISQKLQMPENQIQLLQKFHQQQSFLAQQGQHPQDQNFTRSISTSQMMEVPSQTPISSLPQQMVRNNNEPNFQFSNLSQQPKLQTHQQHELLGSTPMPTNQLSTNGSSLLTGTGSDDGPSCSTSPSTNNSPNVIPSIINNRSYQNSTMGGNHLMNTSGLETISANNNFGKELQQKPDIKPSVNVPKIQNQGFLTPQTYLQNLVGTQIDYLDSSSSATSVCISQNDVHLQPHNSNHLSFNSQPLPFRDSIHDGEVQDDPRNNIPFGVNMDNRLEMSSIIPDPLITKGMMGSDKDFLNNISSGGGLISSYDTPAKDTQPELSSSMVSQSFGVPDMTFNSIDSTINDGALLNGGVWAPPQQQFQRMRTYTKVYKRGAVGRSIDISAYSNYDELKHDLARRFGIEGQLEDRQRIGWKLVYVDHENDVLLVGDDPWEEFVNCVRCIKILSPQEVQQMSLDGDFGGNNVLQNQDCCSSGGGKV